MNNYLGYLFLLFCLICSAVGQTKVGNPDDSSRIERPCPNLDIHCIRKYFVKNAKCKKVDGHVPEPLIRPHALFYYPRINLTVSVYNQHSTGVNGRVEEFYINKDTDKAVIAVEFRKLNISGDAFYFRFHRRAKEPIVTKADAYVVYDSVVITAVIPKINKLQLDRAVCTAFANDPGLDRYVSPSVGDSRDPQVQQTVVEFGADPATNTQEMFLTYASYYIVNYIQYSICDFGLHVT